MSTGEIAGYVASALVFATFYMKTMMRLRIVGIISNAAFIIYAASEGLLPVLILHLSLLPLNIVRLRELIQVIERTREASRGEISIESLLPSMAARRVEAGEVLFRRGDHSAEMFYICEGQIRLPEIGKTLGPGETLGEIGLFAEDHSRMSSAVCETDCELLSISEVKFLQLYNENPRFGFHIARVVTRRLIENFASSAEPRARGREPAASEVEDEGVNDSLDRLDEKRGASAAPAAATVDFARRRRARQLRTVAVFGVFLAILAGGWLWAPLISSLIARDAVVTTWTNLATAPIDGRLRFAGVTPSEAVGEDGVIAVIRNEHLSRAPLDSAKIRVERAQARVREMQAHLDELRALDEDRGEAKARYAEQFRTQLDTDIVNLEAAIATARMQLGVLRKTAERAQRLAERGTVARNDADEAQLRVSALEVRLAAMESDLRATRVRRSAADTGIFLTGTGSDPNWVFDWRMDLKVAKKSARLELRQAEADLAAAEAALAASEADFHRLSDGVVTAPAGSILWSRRLASGATVRTGDPVAEWIGCSNLLVVVPVLNLQVPLLPEGSDARLLLDGENTWRTGKVVLTRGSSSPFDRRDLVALPTDRDDHAGEVAIDISDQHADFDECPVGRSTHVDFPEVGMRDVVAAWLRL